MVLLLPTAWLVLFRLFRTDATGKRVAEDWRYGCLLATAVWGCLVTLGTEALSAATALTARNVGIWWAVVNAVLWLTLLRRQRAGASGAATGGISRMLAWLGSNCESFAKEFRTYPLDVRLMWFATSLLAGFLGVIAIWTPTTNWDSMTYHLARVMHWIQQQSVAHYPSHSDAQLQMGPWSAFVQTHLMLLWGDDRFANMLQWFAMIGSVVAGTLLTRELIPDAGENRGELSLRAQAFAALLIVTLPTGIVQAISTQTDYTTGFWLLSLAALALAWVRRPEDDRLALGVGAVLGLGVLSKLTFVLFALPLGVVLAVALLWRQRRSLPTMLTKSITALAIAAALVSPHMIRNRLVFGSSVGADSAQQQNLPAKVSAAGILSNCIRNLELHGNTGIPALTHALNRTAETLQRWTGRPKDDPDYSSLGLSAQNDMPEVFLVFDSFAASPWHVALILMATAVAVCWWRQHRLALLNLLLAAAGFVIFCAIIRFQIWSSRYHLPLLLLALPATAVVLIATIPRWTSAVASAGLLVFAGFIVVNNQSRPIFDAGFRAMPRMQQYFLTPLARRFYAPMREASREIAAAGCTEVGLHIIGDDADYPWWLMLREAGFHGTIYHQFVSGPSAHLPGPPRLPDVIVSTVPGKPGGEMAQLYPAETTIGPFTLFWSREISARLSQTNNIAK